MKSMILAADEGGYTLEPSTSGSISVLTTPSTPSAHPTRTKSSPPSSTHQLNNSFYQKEQSEISVHAMEHFQSEVKKITEYFQGQIEELGIKMNEGRLNDQRARYRDRELIMQALQKQKEDNIKFTKQVIFNKKTDYSEEIKREEALLHKVKVTY